MISRLRKTLNSKTCDGAASTIGNNITEQIKTRMINHQDFRGRKVKRYSESYQKKKSLSPYKNLGGSLIKLLKVKKAGAGRAEVSFSGKHRTGKPNQEIAGFVIKGRRGAIGRDFFSWDKRRRVHRRIINQIRTKILKGGL